MNHISQPKRQLPIFALILSAYATVAQAAIAPDLLEFQSPRVLSLAGNGRAAPLLTDTIQQNPAALGLQSVQGLQASYNWQNRDPRLVEGQRVMNFSVVDSKNEYAVAGLSLTRRADADLFHLGIGKKLTEWLSVGGTAKRYAIRPNLKIQLGDRTGYDGGVSVAFSSGSADILIPFQIGVTLDNLVRRASDEPTLGARRLSVAAKLSFKGILSTYLDYTYAMGHVTPSSHVAGAGAELGLGSDFYIRAGLTGFKERTWGVGGGWMGPKLGINYGYKKLANPYYGFEQAVSVDIYM